MLIEVEGGLPPVATISITPPNVSVQNYLKTIAPFQNQLLMCGSISHISRVWPLVPNVSIHRLTKKMCNRTTMWPPGDLDTERSVYRPKSAEEMASGRDSNPRLGVTGRYEPTELMLQVDAARLHGCGLPPQRG